MTYNNNNNNFTFELEPYIVPNPLGRLYSFCQIFPPGLVTFAKNELLFKSLIVWIQFSIILSQDGVPKNLRRCYITQLLFEPGLRLALAVVVRRPSCAFWIVHWKRGWWCCGVSEMRRSYISLRNGFGTWASIKRWRVGSTNRCWIIVESFSSSTEKARDGNTV